MIFQVFDNVFLEKSQIKEFFCLHFHIFYCWTNLSYFFWIYVFDTSEKDCNSQAFFRSHHQNSVRTFPNKTDSLTSFPDEMRTYKVNTQYIMMNVIFITFYALIKNKLSIRTQQTIVSTKQYTKGGLQKCSL